MKKKGMPAFGYASARYLTKAESELLKLPQTAIVMYEQGKILTLWRKAKAGGLDRYFSDKKTEAEYCDKLLDYWLT